MCYLFIYFKRGKRWKTNEKKSLLNRFARKFNVNFSKLTASECTLCVLTVNETDANKNRWPKRQNKLWQINIKRDRERERESACVGVLVRSVVVLSFDYTFVGFAKKKQKKSLSEKRKNLVCRRMSCEFIFDFQFNWIEKRKKKLAQVNLSTVKIQKLQKFRKSRVTNSERDKRILCNCIETRKPRRWTRRRENNFVSRRVLGVRRLRIICEFCNNKNHPWVNVRMNK